MNRFPAGISWLAVCVATVHGGVASRAATGDDAVAKAIAVIREVGPNAAGSENARKARDVLSKRGLEILPALLNGMDTTNTVAANWLRTVYDPLVEKSLAEPKTVWPVEELKAFVDDRRRQARARAAALSLLERLEPGFTARWIPTRVDDPGFRYEAVAAVLVRAEKELRAKQENEARADFQLAFRHARDAGQVTQAANQLKSLGDLADVRSHLGLIGDWWLLGPFDAPGKSGFEMRFPPEDKVELTAKYRGQSESDLRWKPHSTKDPLAQINLIEAIANCREAVGYAFTEIELKAPAVGQLRCGADDNCTVWINGRKAFGREQWLNGTRFDRFTAPVQLPAGRSAILVKICQGPQHRDPEVPNNWSFQLRLCDDDGLGLPFQTMPIPQMSGAAEQKH